MNISKFFLVSLVLFSGLYAFSETKEVVIYKVQSKNRGYSEQELISIAIQQGNLPADVEILKDSFNGTFVAFKNTKRNYQDKLNQSALMTEDSYLIKTNLDDKILEKTLVFVKGKKAVYLKEDLKKDVKIISNDISNNIVFEIKESANQEASLRLIMKKANEYGATVDGSAVLSNERVEIYQVEPKRGYSTKELVKHGIEQNLLPKNTVVIDDNTLVIYSSNNKTIKKLSSAGFHVGYPISVDDRELLVKSRSDYEKYFVIKSVDSSRLNDFIEDTADEKIVEAGRSTNGILFKIKDNMQSENILNKMRIVAGDLGILIEDFDFSAALNSKQNKVGACHKLF